MTDNSGFFYQRLVEAAPDAMIVADRGGAICFANQQTEKLFGYTRGELMGQKIEMLVPRRYRAAHPGHRENFLSDPKPRAMGAGRDLFGLRKDNTEVPVEIGLTPVELPEGFFILASIIDITGRKISEEKIKQQHEQLQRMNLELDSFAYTASHDLRAPLRGIHSFAEFMINDYQDRLDDRGRDYLRRIRQSAARLSLLIDNLLHYSRITRVEETVQQVSVREMIDDAEARLAFDIEQHRVDFIRPADLPVIQGNKTQLTEVFVNLIGNAIDYSSKENKERPRVEVVYEDQGNTHLFRIKDNGIGIEPQYHSQIFDMFKRLHGNDQYEGTGIGLSIVKRIILNHQGRVWVESEPGRGATFLFTIPKPH